MKPMDDWQLLREYASRNSEAAFRVLVDRYVELVYHTALRQAGNPHLAQEVTQAVFIALARKAGRIPRKTILSGWLFKATRFAFSNLAREQVRRQWREQEAVRMETAHQSDEVESVSEQLVPLLNDALDALPGKDREAVLVRFFQNKSHRELAAILGVSEDAAKMRVSRAVEKLRLIFAARGFAVPSAVLLAAISAYGAQAAPPGLAAAITSAAVAKGTIGTTSTLTIAKGVLKIMAWTKAKTAIVGSAVVLLAAGTTTITVKEIEDHRTYPWQGQERVINTSQLDQPPQVKIVSSRFHKPSIYTGDKLLGTGVSAQDIVANAYGFVSPEKAIFNVQLPAGRYDYIACLLGGEAANEKALQAAVKSKFGVVGKIETRDTDVWLLRVKYPNAPALKRHTGPNTGNGVLPIPGGFRFWNDGMDNLVASFEFWGNRPVIDGTGLSNRFDFDLNCSEAELVNRDLDAVNSALDLLGLELVPTNMPIEMLIVERAPN
ncbi:MAG: sigma-70 family RNA polymerase sigma factor [Verrucomicrobiota bacterium]